MAAEIPFTLHENVIGKLHVKFGCPSCGKELRYPLEEAGRKATCLGCQASFVVPGMECRPTSHEEQERIRDRVHSHLKSIRSRSCYPFLRNSIDYCFGILLIAICLAGVVLFNNTPNGNPNGNPPKVFGILLYGMLLVFFLSVVRSASILLIDIADTLLNEHSKKSQLESSSETDNM
jgi:predicted RNA-binding Zn-ribbon protein involved in translation (DUF1610 family)